MSETIDSKIRGYINGLPGPMWGNSPGDVITRVKVACGVPDSLEAVRQALWRSGYTPNQVGNRWVIGFPEGGLS